MSGAADGDGGTVGRGPQAGRLRIDSDPSGTVALLLIAGIAFTGAPHPLHALVALFVTVAVHEAGHAAAALRLGATAQVGFNAFGGHTLTPEVGLLSRSRRALLAAAGPGLGLLVAGGASLALAATVPGSSTHALLWWLVRFGIVLNVYNLIPLPASDGAHLLELAVNDRGRPSRRSPVTALEVVATLAVAGLLWRVGLPLIGAVVAGLAASRLPARTRGPEPRVAAVQAAGLRADAQALEALARDPGGPADVLGVVLSRQARRATAVLAARAGRHAEAEDLARDIPDPDGALAVLLALLRSSEQGTQAVAWWVAQRAGRALPPALLEAADAETVLLRWVRGVAPDLSLLDHQTLAQVLIDAERWDDARTLAVMLWERGRGPDAAILVSLATGGAGDSDAAARWLLAARDAGGDVRPFLAHATELAAVRARPGMAALLTEGPHAPGGAPRPASPAGGAAAT